MGDGPGVAGESLSPCSGGALAFGPVPQGSKENLLTVISRATCEEGSRGSPLSAAPSSPRIAQKGYSDCVLWGMWSCLGGSSRGFA